MKSHVYCPPDFCISTLDKSLDKIAVRIRALQPTVFSPQILSHSKPITFQSEKETYNRLEIKNAEVFQAFLAPQGLLKNVGAQESWLETGQLLNSRAFDLCQ